ALTIGRGSPAAFRRCSRRCTQPLSGAMRCADDSESPSTRTGAFAADFAAAAGATAAASNDNDDNSAARNLFYMKDAIGIWIDDDKVSKAVDGPDGRLVILDEVSLSLAPGDSLAIVGASGSGKTTLIGLLAGLDRPTSGAITLAGERLDTLDEEARARLRR